MIKAVPLNRMLLETDAPYMGPYAFRVEYCQPWMALITAQHVASVLKVPVSDVVRAANNNARRLFRLPGLLSARLDLDFGGEDEAVRPHTEGPERSAESAGSRIQTETRVPQPG